jgi:hypothetical protein
MSFLGFNFNNKGRSQRADPLGRALLGERVEETLVSSTKGV